MSQMPAIRLGLIADTHGLLRPEARVALAGVDRIIHAGDICNAQVLGQLAALAPVTAVRGNNDHGDWAAALPETETLMLAGATLHVLHDLNELALDPRTAGIDVVISGHSHRPSLKIDGGVLFIKATLNKSSCVAHPDFGRAAALQILAMAPPCLRFAPCAPSRTQARAITRLVQRSLNPGSAGPRRFRLPISVGFLDITNGVPKAWLQTLEVD